MWIWLATAADAQESVLELKKRVNPAYPEEAMALDLGDARCLATIWIDEGGVPYDLQIEQCPEVFHEGTRAALLEWRWYPPEADGQPVKAQTTIGVTYRVEGAMATEAESLVGLGYGRVLADPAGLGWQPNQLEVRARWSDGLGGPWVWTLDGALVLGNLVSSRFDALVGAHLISADGARLALSVGVGSQNGGYRDGTWVSLHLPAEARLALGTGAVRPLVRGQVAWQPIVARRTADGFTSADEQVAGAAALGLIFGETAKGTIGGLRLDLGWRYGYGGQTVGMVLGGGTEGGSLVR